MLDSTSNSVTDNTFIQFYLSFLFEQIIYEISETVKNNLNIKSFTEC